MDFDLVEQEPLHLARILIVHQGWIDIRLVEVMC